MKYVLIKSTAIMRKVILLMVVLMTATLGFAQTKSVREAKRIADEEKPDFKKAETLINGALTDPETKDDPNTYNVAGYIQKKKIDNENKQLYLTQPYDTIGLYNAAYQMFQYYYKTDQLESIPNEKGKVKHKYRKPNVETMLVEKNNLINGGVYYFNAGKNKEALDFFRTYIDMKDQPMFASEASVKNDTLVYQIAYYAALAAMKLEDYPDVIKFTELSMNDPESRQNSLEFRAQAYVAQGDSAQWIQTLKDGMKQYPTHFYFFGHLIDYYTNSGKYEEALIFANEMIEHNPTDAFSLYVKGFILQNMKRYDEALEFYKKAIEADPNYAEAYSNIGYIYCQQGVDYAEKITIDFDDPKYKEEENKVKSFYEMARPYYEKVRELRPDQKDLWLNGLYTVYYRLNMGPEFEEIEKLM